MLWILGKRISVCPLTMGSLYRLTMEPSRQIETEHHCWDVSNAKTIVITKSFLYLKPGKEPIMTLVKITASDHLLIELAYGTTNNFTGEIIYQNPQCFLHMDAAQCLEKAQQLAEPLGLRLKILDAFRPVEAQYKL